MKIIISALSFLFLLSCQTTPKQNYQLNKLTALELSGYASIKDRVKNKSYLVNFKTRMFKYNLLRLDVTAPFIGHLASLSVIKDQVQYIVPSKKKYYSGPDDSKHLMSLLPFSMESSVLFNVFWGSDIQSTMWECQPAGSSAPESCINKSSQIKVEWERKLGVPSKITINHKRAFVQFLVNDFKPNPKNLNLQNFEIKNPFK